MSIEEPECVTVQTLAGSFRGVILDVFGVLHDGVALFPPVLKTLMNMRSAGMRICLLSNSPRRAIALGARLGEMSLHQDLYDGLMSSGELVHAALSGSLNLKGMPGGPRYFHAGPVELAGLLEDLEYQRVERLVDADFILATGDDERHADWLVQAQERSLPMICANPDIEVIIAGHRVACAGSLARRYEALGGPVRWVGKPGPEAYVAALEILDLPRSQVVMIGDSLATDIAGANHFGLASALVRSGVHRDEMACETAPVRGAFRALCETHGATPDYLLQHLSWDGRL